MSEWINPFTQPTRDERREAVVAETAANLLGWFQRTIASITDEEDGPPPMSAIIARDWARGVVLNQFERNPLMPVVVPIDLAREVADRAAVLFILHYPLEQAGRA
jgi:hypothetical protein